MIKPAKRIIIIAGPNGAGKTTLAREFLPNEAECPTLINADLLAGGLNPLQPERAAIQAGRLMLEMIDACVRRGENFAFETTLSGRGYARMIPRWQEQGHWVTLVFLRLSSPEAAISRVRQRVEQGGHDVPEDVIRRRFHASWGNLEQIYRHLVDEAVIYDVSGDLMVDTNMDEKKQTGEKERWTYSNPETTIPGIEAAMRRATIKARKRAIALTGRVVTFRDGEIVYDTEP